MANKLLSTNSERFLRRIKSHALIARNISRVNCPKLVKMAISKPTKLYEKWSQVKYLFRTTLLLDDIRDFRQKCLVKSSKFVWRKTHPEHKYSVFFFVTKVRKKNAPIWSKLIQSKISQAKSSQIVWRPDNLRQRRKKLVGILNSLLISCFIIIMVKRSWITNLKN